MTLPSLLTLSPEQLAQFRGQGFLAVDGISTPEDVRYISELLDNLHKHFHELSPKYAMDLGDKPLNCTSQIIPEINRTVRLEPRLKDSIAYRHCRHIAHQLLRRTAYYSYDQAIYKPSHNNCATLWHQDQAYAGPHRPLRTVHFWLALQDVNLENGCMQFIPQSHMRGLLPHQRRHPTARSLTVLDVDASTAVACPLTTGGATIHTPTTLHYSGPNNSDAVRRAWVLIFGPYGRWDVLRPSALFAKFREVFSLHA